MRGKPGFRTELVASIIDSSDDERPIWQIKEPLVYSSNLLPFVLRVHAGFQTDFASVPRLPIVYVLTGNTAHKAAVVHDYLYRFHKKHLYKNAITRKVADDVFYEAMLADDISRWRAWVMWSAVRMFGQGSWDRYERKSSSHPQSRL